MTQTPAHDSFFATKGRTNDPRVIAFQTNSDTKPDSSRELGDRNGMDRISPYQFELTMTAFEIQQSTKDWAKILLEFPLVSKREVTKGNFVC